MKKVRFGIIGVGNQGSTYALGLFDKDKVTYGELTAVCDINPVKLDNLREKLSKPVACFSDYIEMLYSGLIDAVIVATPHILHPEMVMESLGAGIHTICEKPAGVYAKQVREMNEFAAGHKALFGMMFNQRTNCIYRKMREIVQSGGIGKIQRVTWIITDWFRTQKYYDAGSWRATWSGEGGGVLINQCPHQLDLLQWVVGELPQSVRAVCHYGKWHDIEVEDDVTVYLEYAGGATGVFVTTTGEYPGTNRFEISGTKGKLLCENNKLKLFTASRDTQEFSRTEPVVFGNPELTETEAETDGYNPQHLGIIENFAAAVLGIEPLGVPGEDGIEGVKLMNAIEYSGWNDGAKVTLPVDEDVYLAAYLEHCKTSRGNNKVADDNAVADTFGTYGTPFLQPKK